MIGWYPSHGTRRTLITVRISWVADIVRKSICLYIETTLSVEHKTVSNMEKSSETPRTDLMLSRRRSYST